MRAAPLSAPRSSFHITFSRRLPEKRQTGDIRALARIANIPLGFRKQSVIVLRGPSRLSLKWISQNV